MPFPFDVPEFHISHIDVETGKTYINWDKVLKHEGDRPALFLKGGRWQEQGLIARFGYPSRQRQWTRIFAKVEIF